MSIELENNNLDPQDTKFALPIPEPLEKLQTLVETLHENNIPSLCQLDKEGLLIGKDESLDDYKIRLDKIFNDAKDLNNELKDNNPFIVYDRLGIKNSDRIEQDLCEEAKVIVLSKYAFSPSLIHSFYAPRNFGFLIGGCAVTFDSGLSVILLRNVFRLKKKWLLYTSVELLAHELCHSARSPIKDNHLEEFFAYNISSSPLRRYIGNCFRSQSDSVLLLFPILLLMAVTILKALFFPSINTVFFWALIFIFPIFLSIRNQIALNKVKKTKKFLSSCILNKENIMPLLFRCTFDEITSISGMTDKESFDSFINKKKQTELRWKVISSRFVE